MSLMREECGWCGMLLGHKECTPEFAGQVSHGMCERCYAKQQGDALLEAIEESFEKLFETRRLT